MFIHSIKVHRIYKTAAKIVKQVLEDGKGVKQLLFEQKHVNIKTLNALVFETLKHARILDLLIQRTNILFNEPRLDPWLARVLMTELLWGKKDKLVSEAKPIKTILTYSKKFQAVLRDLSVGMPEQIQEALTTSEKLPQTYHPRYVRVNTLTMTVQEAVDGFRDEGWILMRHEIGWTYTDFLKAIRELQPEHFIPDFHIPELFVFPPDTQFHDYQCYLQGHIVLQDKASCMAAHLLSPEPGSNVLDMCAAPGMKTTHLAAMVGNSGTIYAIEKDERRYGVLCNIVQATNSSCVKTINDDALKITDEQCPDVEYILVDPSCSGTGMLGRIETAKPVQQDHRLTRLSGFQILILRRALTAFPKAKRVLYSTCSTMTQENEQVVKEVLETTKQFRLVPAKELLKKDWLSFGSKEYAEIGESCLYSKSETDYTNGFFMAVFERIAPHDENDVYIKGKKWIKQEPEDYNDVVDDKNDMVNYGITNDNMIRNIKSEYDQEIADDYSNNIKSEPTYGDTRKIKQEKKKRKHAEVDETNGQEINDEKSIIKIEDKTYKKKKINEGNIENNVNEGMENSKEIKNKNKTTIIEEAILSTTNVSEKKKKKKDKKLNKDNLTEDIESINNQECNLNLEVVETNTDLIKRKNKKKKSQENDIEETIVEQSSQSKMDSSTLNIEFNVNSKVKKSKKNERKKSEDKIETGPEVICTENDGLGKKKKKKSKNNVVDESIPNEEINKKSKREAATEEVCEEQINDENSGESKLKTKKNKKSKYIDEINEETISENDKKKSKKSIDISEYAENEENKSENDEKVNRKKKKKKTLDNEQIINCAENEDVPKKKKHKRTKSEIS